MSTEVTEGTDPPSPGPEKGSCVPCSCHDHGSGEESCPSHPACACQSREGQEGSRKNRFLFFAIVSSIVLLLDIGSKVWAQASLFPRGSYAHGLVLIDKHLTLVLAYNQGGAWGFLHDAPAIVRRPFFVLVSLVAIAFIVSLYRKVQSGQWTLIWGLPLVLGGALGNLTDRITRIGVVDFVDYRARWVEWMNEMIAKVSPQWTVTDHWPTYNVADIAICVGVGLMALDVLFTRRSHPPLHHHCEEPRPASVPSGNTP
jgi:signal peptidase II